MSNRTGGRLDEPAANLFLANDTRDNPSDHRNGGAGRDRTDDILLAKQVLSQLSYGP